MHPLIRTLFTTRGTPYTALPIGLGTWQFAPEHWGDIPASRAKAIVRRALERGVRHIDCAESYGKGRAEQLVGQAVRREERRREVTFATKSVARTPDVLRKHLYRSVTRLERAQVEIYYLHWFQPALSPEGAVQAFEEVQRDGTFRYLGGCNLDVDDPVQRALVRHFDVVQFAMNLIWRREEGRLLRAAKEVGVATIAYSPLQQGILARRFPEHPVWDERDHRQMLPLFRGDAWRAVHPFHERYHALCEGHDQSPAAVALLWLFKAGIDGVVVGFRHPSQVDALFDGLERARSYAGIDPLLAEANELSLRLQDHIPTVSNPFAYFPLQKRR